MTTGFFTLFVYSVSKSISAEKLNKPIQVSWRNTDFSPHELFPLDSPEMRFKQLYSKIYLLVPRSHLYFQKSNIKEMSDLQIEFVIKGKC